MPGLVINALLTSFFLVRLMKGGWLRHPQAVAVATVASLAALLALGSVDPGAENSVVYGNLAALAGAWLGVLACDRILGTS